MATLRKFLSLRDFDFANGRLLLRRSLIDGGYLRGDDWGQSEGVWVQLDDPILDVEFDSGFGSAECFQYVAEDDSAIYFPSQHDGSTSPEKVWKDLCRYEEIEVDPPFPGG